MSNDIIKVTISADTEVVHVDNNGHELCVHYSEAGIELSVSEYILVGPLRIEAQSPCRLRLLHHPDDADPDDCTLDLIEITTLDAN